jgi:hypothetical protein
MELANMLGLFGWGSEKSLTSRVEGLEYEWGEVKMENVWARVRRLVRECWREEKFWVVSCDLNGEVCAIAFSSRKIVTLKRTEVIGPFERSV